MEIPMQVVDSNARYSFQLPWERSDRWIGFLQLAGESPSRTSYSLWECCNIRRVDFVVVQNGKVQKDNLSVAATQDPKLQLILEQWCIVVFMRNIFAVRLRTALAMSEGDSRTSRPYLRLMLMGFSGLAGGPETSQACHWR
jgi:hypothetical protein